MTSAQNLPFQKTLSWSAFLIFPENRVCFSYKSSAKLFTVCINVRSCFLRKWKESNTSLSSAEFAQGVLMKHEPWGEKRYLLSWATNENSNQPAHSDLIRIFAIWPESLLSAWRNFALLAFQNAPSEDSDQTARMRRLIWIFSGCTCPKYVAWRFGSLQNVAWRFGPLPDFFVVFSVSLLQILILEFLEKIRRMARRTVVTSLVRFLDQVVIVRPWTWPQTVPSQLPVQLYSVLTSCTV